MSSAFLGRPGPRSVKSSFNRAAVASTQGAGPKGRPRRTQSRTSCSSSSDRPPSTKVVQFRDRCTGQGLKTKSLLGWAPPESAPSPLLGTLHQFGAHGVGLDVAAEREEVLVLCHGKALVSPLVQVSCPPAVIVLVVPADVRHPDPPHQPPQRNVGPRPDDQMPVIGHQAVSQQSHRITLQPLDQHLLEGVEVALLLKQSQASVPPIEDLVNHPSFNGSRGGKKERH